MSVRYFVVSSELPPHVCNVCNACSVRFHPTLPSDFLYTRGEIGGETWVLIRGIVRLLPTHLTANYSSAELLQMPYLRKLENEGILSSGALLQP